MSALQNFINAYDALRKKLDEVNEDPKLSAQGLLKTLPKHVISNVENALHNVLRGVNNPLPSYVKGVGDITTIAQLKTVLKDESIIENGDLADLRNILNIDEKLHKASNEWYSTLAKEAAEAKKGYKNMNATANSDNGVKLEGMNICCT